MCCSGLAPRAEDDLASSVPRITTPDGEHDHDDFDTFVVAMPETAIQTC